MTHTALTTGRLSSPAILALAAMLLGTALAARAHDEAPPLAVFEFSGDDLESFFNPSGSYYAPCAAGISAIPAGLVEAIDDEAVFTNSGIFGISLLILRPAAAAAILDGVPNWSVRLRVKFETASQLSVSVKTHVGIDEDQGLVLSEIERGYALSIFPEDAFAESPAGAISIAEFGRCHNPVRHPEWPGADALGVATAPAPEPLPRDVWHRVEVAVRVDGDGAATIEARVWPDDGARPDAPLLSVIDPNGILLDAARHGPDTRVELAFGASLDYPDPTLQTREPGATLRIDDVEIRDLDDDGHDGPGPFVRGDVNGDDAVNISDASSLLNFLFLGGPEPLGPCPDAADGNDDAEVNLSDAIYLLGGLFLGGPAPPAPHPECGQDPTGDALASCLREDCGGGV